MPAQGTSIEFISNKKEFIRKKTICIGGLLVADDVSNKIGRVKAASN
jgi:hypothetical protein